MSDERPFVIAIRDTVTGVVLRGTVMADSEIDAREAIRLTIERAFLGTQPVRYDRVPDLIAGNLARFHQVAFQIADQEHYAYQLGDGDV